MAAAEAQVVGAAGAAGTAEVEAERVREATVTVEEVARAVVEMEVLMVERAVGCLAEEGTVEEETVESGPKPQSALAVLQSAWRCRG